jgi:hypothetical protein
MILNAYIEYKSQDLSKRFLYWVVDKSKDRVTDMPIYFSQLEFVYPKKKFFCLGIDMKIRRRVFRILVDAGRLKPDGKSQYIFSKFYNADLFRIKENKNATT